MKTSGAFGNIAAVCDVDAKRAEAASKQFNTAQIYKDFRKLLERDDIHAVINGHVHVHSFTPAGKDHSYSQLIGGGPKPEAATVIEGHADGRELSLVLRDLGGKELGNYAFKS